MFGLGNQKNTPFFQHDLEKKVKDKEQREKMVQDIEQKIGKIKKLLGEGAKSEEYEALGDLLKGYYSLLKVISSI